MSTRFAVRLLQDTTKVQRRYYLEFSDFLAYFQIFFLIFRFSFLFSNFADFHISEFSNLQIFEFTDFLIYEFQS